ncbi:hypothetical protein BSKO_04486 [Bryopsis sp. KO-2023]|nr:hypothetical protein BSKO_04486 [Bryopsis sp. KO-2023]
MASPHELMKSDSQRKRLDRAAAFGSLVPVDTSCRQGAIVNGRRAANDVEAQNLESFSRGLDPKQESIPLASLLSHYVSLVFSEHPLKSHQKWLRHNSGRKSDSVAMSEADIENVDPSSRGLRKLPSENEEEVVARGGSFTSVMDDLGDVLKGGMAEGCKRLKRKSSEPIIHGSNEANMGGSKGSQQGFAEDALVFTSRFTEPLEWLTQRAQQSPLKPRLIAGIEKYRCNEYDSAIEAALTNMYIYSHYFFEIMSPTNRKKRPVFTWAFPFLALLVFTFMAGEYEAWAKSEATGDVGKMPSSGFGPMHLVHWLESLRSDSKRTFLPEFVVLWGGRFLPKVKHEGWRWITSMLIHENAVHLVTNMFLFMVLSSTLERRFGFWRVTAVSLLSGLGGNFSSALGEDPCLVVVGASGMVFGLSAMYLLHVCTEFVRIRYPLFRIVGLVLFWVTVLSSVSPERTSGMSHIGGFLAGLTMGIIMMPSVVTETIESLAVGSSVVGGVVFFAILPCLTYFNTIPGLVCRPP